LVSRRAVSSVRPAASGAGRIRRRCRRARCAVRAGPRRSRRKWPMRAGLGVHVQGAVERGKSTPSTAWLPGGPEPLVAHRSASPLASRPSMSIPRPGPVRMPAPRGGRALRGRIRRCRDPMRGGGVGRIEAPVAWHPQIDQGAGGTPAAGDQAVLCHREMPAGHVEFIRVTGVAHRPAARRPDGPSVTIRGVSSVPVSTWRANSGNPGCASNALPA